ncbi:MAG: hypothetical protein N3D10_00365 [Candidatus Micrarchaeota archaeon]|nr:hypothetical protein [Candidatus Micrarchaeota archaeon]
MDVLSLLKKSKIKLRASGPDNLCPICKKNGRVHCPHKPLIKIKKLAVFEKDYFFGPTPPNVFVPHNNYPNIFPQQIFLLDGKINANPSSWYGWDFKKIIYASAMQLRASFAQHSSQSIEKLQESILSIKPVDLEANYLKKPSLFVNFDQVSYPLGPKAVVDKISLASNPSIPKKVDSLLQENIPITLAVKELLEHGFDEFYISRVLSAALLGKERNKKFVPTRWSITATDSILARFYINKIKNFGSIDKFFVYENFYLANKFSIILFPGNWEFENIECWCASKEVFSISQEREGYFGRTSYASKQGGGYYATLVAIAEKLFKLLKKQAKVLVIREIMPDYDLPVGVWEIRENVRHAFEKEPKKFETKSELFNYLSTSLFLEFKNYLKYSKILTQSTLKDY